MAQSFLLLGSELCVKRGLRRLRAGEQTKCGIDTGPTVLSLQGASPTVPYGSLPIQDMRWLGLSAPQGPGTASRSPLGPEEHRAPATAHRLLRCALSAAGLDLIC